MGKRFVLLCFTLSPGLLPDTLPHFCVRGLWIACHFGTPVCHLGTMARIHKSVIEDFVPGHREAIGPRAGTGGWKCLQMPKALRRPPGTA